MKNLAKTVCLWRYLSLLIVAIFCHQAIRAKTWTLSDTKLEIRFDDQTALLSVTDKRCNKVWEQAPLKDQFKVTNTVQKGNSLQVRLSGKYTFDVNLVLTEASALEINLTGDAKTAIGELGYPSAFITPDKKLLFA